VIAFCLLRNVKFFVLRKDLLTGFVKRTDSISSVQPVCNPLSGSSCQLDVAPACRAIRTRSAPFSMSYA
jgi:hypothetical protein